MNIENCKNDIVRKALEAEAKSETATNAHGWGNLLEQYTDRAIQAEQLGKVHESALWKRKANELMKILRRADTGKCKMWNVRSNADGDGKADKADGITVEWQRNGWTGDDFRRSAIANPIVSNAVSSNRTPEERIDAELMESGQCANMDDARQWLEANRYDLVNRYGADEYNAAYERWIRNPDIL